MPLLGITKLFFSVSISFLPTIFFKKQNSTETVSPGRGEVNLCVISGKILLKKSCNSKNYREVIFTIWLSSELRNYSSLFRYLFYQPSSLRSKTVLSQLAQGGARLPFVLFLARFCLKNLAMVKITRI